MAQIWTCARLILCVSVSLWLILSVFSRFSVSITGAFLIGPDLD